MRRIIDLLLPQGVGPRCAECRQAARTSGLRCEPCRKRLESVAAYLQMRVRRMHASSTRWGSLAEDVRKRSRLGEDLLRPLVDAERAERPLNQFDHSQSQGHADVHPTSPLVACP